MSFAKPGVTIEFSYLIGTACFVRKCYWYVPLSIVVIENHPPRDVVTVILFYFLGRIKLVSNHTSAV